MRHTHFVLVVSLLLVFACRIASAAPQSAPPPAKPSSEPPTPAGGVSQADLREMLGPIALYPDELLANVLAASIYPDELKAANSYVSRGADAAKIPDQGWESSVNAIARIPDVLTFLVDNIDWTTAVGQAYIVQSSDVMKAVQALRTKAKKNGALKTTPQQTVIEDGSTIIIAPADPQVIYVPTYQPEVVYVDSGPSTGDVIAAGVIGFGVGLAIGACFDDDFDCDWHGGCIGWGWGHNDVDIDRNVNIQTGDININSNNKNTVNRNKNVNNVGREGTKWEPNPKKVDTAKVKSGGATQLQNFRDVSSNKNAQASHVPKATTANTGRPSPAAVPRDAARPRPSANAPARASPSAKPPTPKTAPKSPSPVAKSAPPQSKPSAFSPDRGSGKSSARGASSRGGRGGHGR